MTSTVEGTEDDLVLEDGEEIHSCEVIQWIS